MLDFIGKLHLLLLHLPIGILGFAFLMEITARWNRKKRPLLHDSSLLALGWGAPVSVITALCGWLLARQGGYEEGLLQKHQWLGFGTAALACLCWWMRNTGWYAGLLTVCVSTLAVAGHYGGALTHGEGYLFKKGNNSNTAAAANDFLSKINPQSIVFQDIIQPILQKKCSSCHNPNKRKGELLLDTPEHMMQGGKHGAVLLPAEPEKSPLLLNILLPLHDDNHMPPAGKPQLSADELTLLRWWIGQGVDFQKHLGDMKMTPEVEKVFAQAAGQGQNPVFALSVPAASPKDIETLRGESVSVMSLTHDSPWLAVSMIGSRKMSKDLMLKIKTLGAQITDLDCSNTNIDDQMLSVLRDLPHLTRLNLAHTGVSDAGLQSLKDLQYLDYLNLVGTKVTDALISNLNGLKNLHTVYVWNTAVSISAAAMLSSKIPGLQVNTGAPVDSAAPPMTLRPPKIMFARNIFEDTVRVAFDYPKMVDVHYAFDEASPTTQSPKFDGNPLIINKSTKVRALVTRPGWSNSPIVEASFAKRKYKIKSATLEHPPSPKYPGEGAASLYNGKIADTYTDKDYLGYEGEHLTAILDMGEPIRFSRLSIHCIENNSSWIFSPHGLHVWTSNDGKNWQKSINAQYAVNGSMQEAKPHVITEAAASPVQCRYLKVQVESLLKNPPWHPGAGQKCWVFVDEMLVE